MTLTVKDASETAGLKSGLGSQNSEGSSGHSSRSDPVCLEVPVVVRCLPGESLDGSGTSSLSRAEARTVIVFDKGAVLRIANPLNSGQTVILTNQQGRDVVCRVVTGRSLPKKGYVEVDFVERIDDFWHIHQNLEGSKVAAPAPEGLLSPLPQASAAGTSRESRVMQSDPSSAQDPNAVLGSAPTFEDVADLVRMSPSATVPEKAARKTVTPPRAPSSRGQMASSGATQDAVRVGSQSALQPTLGRPQESVPENDDVATTPETAPIPAPQTGVSNELAQPTFGSAYGASASTSSESKGRTPLIIGGAVLALAGFGAGFFLMHRGNAPAVEPVATAIASSAPTAQPSANPAFPSADSAVGQTQTPQSSVEPISTPTALSSSAPEAEISASPSARRAVNPAIAKAEDQTPAHRQTIPSLRMSSPIKANQSRAKLPEGAQIGAAEVTATDSTSTLEPATLPSVMRNQPTPPSAPASVPLKVMREASLISSTPPAYPALAKQSSVEGSVVVNASVDSYGNVVEAKAVSGPVLLRQAALDAVKKWKYSPATADGKPMSSQISVRLQFNLH